MPVTLLVFLPAFFHAPPVYAMAPMCLEITQVVTDSFPQADMWRNDRLLCFHTIFGLGSALVSILGLLASEGPRNCDSNNGDEDTDDINVSCGDAVGDENTGEADQLRYPRDIPPGTTNAREAGASGYPNTLLEIALVVFLRF